MLYRLAARADVFSDEDIANAQHDVLERGYALISSLLNELVPIANEAERRQWLACSEPDPTL